MKPIHKTLTTALLLSTCLTASAWSQEAAPVGDLFTNPDAPQTSRDFRSAPMTGDTSLSTLTISDMLERNSVVAEFDALQM